jgi:phage-related protein (TIGR01555 family)
MHARFERSETHLSLDWPLLDSLYHEDDISGRIVDIIPAHMFRKGWDLQVADDTSKKLAKGFNTYAKKLQIKKRTKLATIWGRLKGGALLQLGIDDNRTLDQPVDEANIRAVKYVNVIERQYILANTYYTDPFEEKCGEPATYLITNAQIGPSSEQQIGLGTFVIHESRTVRFEGATTSKLERQRLGGWTHTVLQRPYEKIKAFVQAFQAAGNLMTDAAQGVYKLDQLMGQIAGNEKDALATRMMMIDMGRSVARAIILDKDGEEFERSVATISGYPEMLDRFMMLLSAATDGIPVTLLMGRSAAGMNSTGDSDFRQFYDLIETKQEDELEPQLQRIYRYFSLAKDGPTQGREVEFTFKFRSLWTPTAMERSQINFTQSQADLNYVTMGAVTGEEVAISRFGDGELDLSTKVDMEGRQDAQEAGEMFDPYHGEDEPEKGATAGELDLKRQGNIAPPNESPAGVSGGTGVRTSTRGPSNGRAGKTTRPNSSQPGYKSGSGR